MLVDQFVSESLSCSITAFTAAFTCGSIASRTRGIDRVSTQPAEGQAAPTLTSGRLERVRLLLRLRVVASRARARD
jgi:hypothetical protein